MFLNTASYILPNADSGIIGRQPLQPQQYPSSMLSATPEPPSPQQQIQTSPPPQSSQADQSQASAEPLRDFPPSTVEVEPDLADAVKRRSARRQQQATPPLNTPSPQPPSSSQNSNQSQQGIPIIQSPNDPAFAAFPSGAQFVTPDGKIRKKK